MQYPGDGTEGIVGQGKEERGDWMGGEREGAHTHTVTEATCMPWNLTVVNGGLLRSKGPAGSAALTL